MDLRIRPNEQGLNWIHLAQGRDRWRAYVNIVIYILFLSSVYNVLTSRATISSSRRRLLRGISSAEHNPYFI
jgi:hypothetical protein